MHSGQFLLFCLVAIISVIGFTWVFVEAKEVGQPVSRAASEPNPKLLSKESQVEEQSKKPATVEGHSDESLHKEVEPEQRKSSEHTPKEEIKEAAAESVARKSSGKEEKPVEGEPQREVSRKEDVALHTGLQSLEKPPNMPKERAEPREGTQGEIPESVTERGGEEQAQPAKENVKREASKGEVKEDAPSINREAVSESSEKPKELASVEKREEAERPSSETKEPSNAHPPHQEVPLHAGQVENSKSPDVNHPKLGHATPPPANGTRDQHAPLKVAGSIDKPHLNNTIGHHNNHSTNDTAARPNVQGNTHGHPLTSEDECSSGEESTDDSCSDSD